MSEEKVNGKQVEEILNGRHCCCCENEAKKIIVEVGKNLKGFKAEACLDIIEFPTKDDVQNFSSLHPDASESFPA